FVWRRARNRGFWDQASERDDLIRAIIRAAVLLDALASGTATPVDAHRLDAAARAKSRVAPRRASLEHAHVAEREVVGHRVGGIEPRERARDLFRRLPRRPAPPRKPKVSTEAMDVYVDRHEEAGRWNLPHAQVDPIGRSRHPPQKQQQALATARALR